MKLDVKSTIFSVGVVQAVISVPKLALGDVFYSKASCGNTNFICCQTDEWMDDSNSSGKLWTGRNSCADADSTAKPSSCHDDEYVFAVGEGNEPETINHWCKYDENGAKPSFSN